jgi:hypothetical protein
VSPKGILAPFHGLFRVAIGGGPVQTLADGFPTGSGLFDMQLGPDDAQVFYEADQDSAGVFELYAVPSDGGTPRKLSAPLVSGGNVVSFEIGADGTTLVYRADQDTDDAFELYGVANIEAPLPQAIFADSFESMVTQPR